MAPYASGETSDEGPVRPDGSTAAGTAQSRPRRRSARYVVPFAVVGVAGATIGLVPALADAGDPDLPEISAQQLVEKVAASDVQQLSGTVKINTDLGLPDFGGFAASLVPHAAGSPGKSSADPESRLTELASGTHTLRVAVSGPDRQKLSVLDDAAEYTVIHNGREIWAYDSASNEAYHVKNGGTYPKQDRHGAKGDAPTPGELARKVLEATDDTTSVSVDGTQRVAGRDAYRLVVKPRQTGSTVGVISIAVDARTGTPLKFTLTPASGGSAVVDVGFTKVDFAEPDASTFRFTPPKGTKVTEEDWAKKNLPHHDLPKGTGHKGEQRGPGDVKVIGEGWNAVAELTLPGAKGLPSAGSDQLPPDAQGLLDSFGNRAHGKFGSGTVFSTRLINALITQDGKVYVGAVDKDALVKVANRAH